MRCTYSMWSVSGSSLVRPLGRKIPAIVSKYGKQKGCVSHVLVELPPAYVHFRTWVYGDRPRIYRYVGGRAGAGLPRLERTGLR